METMGLFTFCIPLIAREKSKNWQRVIDNLQATLQSILNQIDSNFVVYIATNDQIELQEAHDPRVFLVPVPSFKMPSIAQKEYNKSNFDANAKRVLLTEKAYAHNAPYIMYCDADDLVSNTLVQFVYQNPHPNGYAIRHGYVMDYSSGKRLPCPSNYINLGFDRFCGTSIILARTDENTMRSNWPFGERIVNDHSRIRETLSDAGRPLMDIQHPSVVYILNSGENLSYHTTNGTDRIEHADRVISHIQTYGSPLSPSLLKEFGLV